MGKVRYQITERITVGQLAEAGHKMDIWIPLPLEEPTQRIEGRTIEGPLDFSVAYDPDHGNPILHGTTRALGQPEIVIRVDHLVERSSYASPRAGKRQSPVSGDRGAWFSDLRPERHVDIDERTCEIAREVVGDERDTLEQMRKLYNHVVGFMDYDAEKQSFKGSTEHALVCQIGNCNDIHSLYLSLARSRGIPSRMVMGIALEPPVDGEEDCDICGYHCWAESWVQGVGWVPVDASCACKYHKDQLFGDIETNHIAYSRGRDVLLQPRQRGDRVLYFATPYVEVDGIAHSNVVRAISFKQLNGESSGKH